MSTQVNNTGAGYQIGATSSEKIGIFGATPITQVSAPANGTNNIGAASSMVGVAANTNTTYKGTVGTSNYTVSDIVTALKNFGLIAQ